MRPRTAGFTHGHQVAQRESSNNGIRHLRTGEEVGGFAE